MTTTNRDLSKLEAWFKRKVNFFLTECKKAWFNIFVVEWWRNEERQKELIKTGASQLKRSMHQDWLAIDIWFLGKELYPKDYWIWRKVADIAKQSGIVWWFDLWRWDKPHFQNDSTILFNDINMPQIPQWAEYLITKVKEKGITTPLDTPLEKIELYQLLVIMDKWNQQN